MDRADAPLGSRQNRLGAEAGDGGEVERAQYGGDGGVRVLEIGALALGGGVDEDEAGDGGGGSAGAGWVLEVLEVQELARHDAAVGVGEEDEWGCDCGG